MIALAPDLEACLRDCARSPMKLDMNWIGQGERRGRVAYCTGQAGVWYDVRIILRLAELGLVEGADADCNAMRASPAGRDWLKAQPPPAAA